MDAPVEKPYEFVPFPDNEVQREPTIGHQHFVAGRLSGQIVLRLTAQRPIQVASGALDVRQTQAGEEVVAEQVTTRRNGKKVTALPGSSLKGALRSIVEALSPSCVRVTGWSTRKALPEQMNACRHVDKLCPACRMFGMTGQGRESYLGQVQVQDGLLVSGKTIFARTPLLWTPARKGLSRRYMAGQQVGGRKFYYHGIAAKGLDVRVAAGTGSVFEVRIDFANLTPAELGLLVTALGQHPQQPFLLKVGAAKPVGMGSVAVEIVEVNLLGDVRRSGRAGAGQTTLTGEELKTRLKEEWIAAAEQGNLLNKPALVKLWKILRVENLSHPSPEGMY